MDALLTKGLNCGKQLEVWKAAAKKVLQEWKNMSPEEAVDCLKCINKSGYQDNEFWGQIGKNLIETNGLATDLEGCIDARNIMLKNLPDDLETYFTMQKKCIGTIWNFGMYKAQKLTRDN